MVFLAFITVTGVMYTGDRPEAPAVASEGRAVRALVNRNAPERLDVVEQPTQLAQVAPEQLRPPQQALQQPRPDEVIVSDAPFMEPADIQMNEDRQRQLESSSDVSSEGVMRDEGGGEFQE